MDIMTTWFLFIGIPTTIAMASVMTKILLGRSPFKWIESLLPIFSLWLLLLAMLGAFTIMFRMNGMYMQPLTPTKYEKVEEPLYRIK